MSEIVNYEIIVRTYNIHIHSRLKSKSIKNLLVS